MELLFPSGFCLRLELVLHHCCDAVIMSPRVLSETKMASLLLFNYYGGCKNVSLFSCRLHYYYTIITIIIINVVIIIIIIIIIVVYYYRVFYIVKIK